MLRGEIWTQSGGPDYAGKPRPVVILQSDELSDTRSIITCGLTTQRSPPLYSRPQIEPVPANGLRKRSEVMTDKISTVARSKLGERLGALTADDMARVQQALMLVLGFEE
jgi:mRNA interferase MazF